MIRIWKYLQILLLSGTMLAAGGYQTELLPDAPSESAGLAPIPTSAVSHSETCSRLAELQEELQGNLRRRDLQRVEGPQQSAPLTPSGKFKLAMKNAFDPINVAGTALDAGISNATSSSTSAFGTGWPGFGRRFGMSMADEVSGEFFSTYVFSSIFHQDPHYHRDPDAPTLRRIGYALSRVAVARSDFGQPMFNYAEILGTATASVFQNSYRFDRDTSPGATTTRIFVSIGSDAAWNLMTEFLPDVARHVNPRFIFLRRLAERAAQQN
ncbi:MAG TPA: hypothetical protein VFQ00_13085 [Terriglobales bacterium]|nr:hypothetical protein [Terriglobales bacterium]